MACSESAHSCFRAKPGLGSIYFLFHTALCDHWGALWLISTKSLFRSFSPSKSSSSCRVASRWAQFCRTAPSICNGQPTGICDCSRSPSPFCSMIVPSIGTSMAAFRLICARLQFRVSGASKPRLASFASAGNSGCSLRGSASSLTTSLRPCIGSCSVWDVGSLVGAISSNQVGRMDFTPIVLAELAFLMLSLRRLWYIGNHPCGDKHGDELHVPWYLQVLGLKSGWCIWLDRRWFVCMTAIGQKMPWLWGPGTAL